MKRIFLLISVIVFTLTIAGCGSDGTEKTVSFSEDAIRSELERLLPLSEEIAAIFRGNIEIEDAEYKPDENGQCFVPVTDSRFKTTDDLKVFTEEVFTKEYAEEMFYKYGFEGDYVKFRDIDGKLNMDISSDGGGGNEYFISTMKLVSDTDDTIVVTLDSQNIYGDKGVSTVTLKKSGGKLFINNIEKVFE